jgi:predicted TIM-barrel fold metal-dependent hydrolase
LTGATHNCATDVHQHIWPPAMLEALRRRSAPPRLTGDGWTLELAGEPDYAVNPADHDPEVRGALAQRDGMGRVLVSLSSPMGIESLPGDEGAELLDAWHEGALALPGPFGAWAAASLPEVDAGALARELDRGFIGLQLPATALRDAAGYTHLRELLELLEARARPLFIHPGPATGPVVGAPTWWPAIVDYVAQMHAAWFAFRAFGRRRHPRLRVVFAMQRGERTVIDPDVFLETSSYGPRAIDAIVRVSGIDTLVHGSDRPYAPPPRSGLGAAGETALRVVNPARLLTPDDL